jgi:23S rRNA (guanosine2251-2'-O)-methyltransferase
MSRKEKNTMGKRKNEDGKYYRENTGEQHEETGKIEGKNPVLEALKADRTINRIYIEKGSKDPVLEKIYAVARGKGIVVSYVEKSRLDQLSETRNHQGVIADVAPYSYADVEDILEKARNLNQPPLILILDGITDPNNLGSIVRTAECAGVHGIILPKRRAAALTPVVAKVAAGAAEYIPIARVTNLTRTIQDLKEAGLWIAGADMHGETDYSEYDYKSPLAIVIGSEGEGISRLVRENCDVLIRIPMFGKINSLNAAIAAALIVFKAAEKRAEAGIISYDK